MPEPLLLRSAYQMPLTLAASSQFVPVAPEGDIGTVCSPMRTVAFTENQTAALPVPAGLAAVIRSEEILNLNLLPCMNTAMQLRCDGITDRSRARAELLDSAVQNVRTACSAALACDADSAPDAGGGDGWPKPPPELETPFEMLWLNAPGLRTSLAGGAKTCTGIPKS